MFFLLSSFLVHISAQEVSVLVCDKLDDACQEAQRFGPILPTVLQLNSTFKDDLAKAVGTNPLSLYIGPVSGAISWDSLPSVDLSIMAVFKGFGKKEYYPMSFDFGSSDDYTLTQPSVSIGKPDDYDTTEVSVKLVTTKQKLTLRVKTLNISDGGLKSTANLDIYVDRLFADFDYISDQTQTFIVKKSVSTLNTVDGNVTLSTFKVQDGSQPVFLIPDDLGSMGMTFEFGKNRHLKCTGMSTRHNVSFSMTVPDGMSLSYYEGESYKFYVTPCTFILTDPSLTRNDLPTLAITTILESVFNFVGTWPTYDTPVVTITSLQKFCNISAESDVPIEFSPGSKAYLGFTTLAHLTPSRYQGCEIVVTTEARGLGQVELKSNKITLTGFDGQTTVDMQGTAFKIVNELEAGKAVMLKYQTETTVTDLTIDFERGKGSVKFDASWQNCNSQIVTLQSASGSSYLLYGYVFYPSKIDLQKVATVKNVNVVATPVTTLCLSNQYYATCPDGSTEVESEFLDLYIEGLDEQATVYVSGSDVPVDLGLLTKGDFKFQKVPSKYMKSSLLIEMQSNVDVTTNLGFDSLGLTFKSEKTVTFNAPKMTINHCEVSGEGVTIKRGDISVAFTKQFQLGISIDSATVSIVPLGKNCSVGVGDNFLNVSDNKGYSVVTASSICITNMDDDEQKVSAYSVSYIGTGQALPDLSFSFTVGQNITFAKATWPTSKKIPISCTGILNLTVNSLVPLDLAKQTRLMTNFHGLKYLDVEKLDLADLAVSTEISTVTNAYIGENFVVLSTGTENATLKRKFNLTVVLEARTRLFVTRLDGITSFSPLITIMFDVSSADCEFDISWNDYTGSSKIPIDSVANSFWEQTIVTVFHHFSDDTKVKAFVDILCPPSYIEFQRVTSSNLCVCGDVSDPLCRAKCPFKDAEYILSRQIEDFVAHSSSTDPHIYIHFAQTSVPDGSVRIDWTDLRARRPIMTSSLTESFKVILEINDAEENIDYLNASNIHFKFHSDHWMDPDLHLTFKEIYLQNCYLSSDEYLKDFIFSTTKGDLSFTPGSKISIDVSSETPFTVPAYGSISVSGDSVKLTDGTRFIEVAKLAGGLSIIDSNITSIEVTSPSPATVPLSFTMTKAASINISSGNWEKSGLSISAKIEPCTIILNSKIPVTFTSGSKIATNMASAAYIEWGEMKDCDLNISIKSVDEIKLSQYSVTISSTESIPTFTIDRSKFTGTLWLAGTGKYETMTLSLAEGTTDVKGFNLHLDENAHVTLPQGWYSYTGTPIYIDNVGMCTFKVFDYGEPKAFTFRKPVFVDWEVTPPGPTQTSSVPEPTTTGESQGSGNKTGIIVAATLVPIIVIIAVVVGVIVFRRIRRKNDYSREITFELASNFDSMAGTYTTDENIETYTPV